MPTGYTERLYNGEQAFEEYALRCARAFGALIEMRDTGLDATIPDEFEASPYHREHQEAAVARLATLQAMPDAEAQAKAAAGFEEWRADRLRTEADRRSRLARYQAMRAAVVAWTPPTEDHVPLRDFMVEQLDSSMDFDCGEFRLSPPPKTGPKWKAAAIARAERDIEYHAAEYAKDLQRAAERTAWVRALRDSLRIPETAVR